MDEKEWQTRRKPEQVDKLTPSLLARAFAGKLVPPNSTEERAEKLLEGIALRKNQTLGL